MTVSHANLIAALEGRYDYYSARVVLKEILASAEVAEKTSYEPAEVASIVQVIRKWGDRTEHVLDVLTAPDPVPDIAVVEPAASGGGASEPSADPASDLLPAQPGGQSDSSAESGASDADSAGTDGGDSELDEHASDDKSTHGKKAKPKKTK